MAGDSRGGQLNPPELRQPSFMRRFAAAESTDPDTLVGLACDESYFVRRQAAQNPATPAWILELLTRAGASADLRGKGRPDLTLEGSALRKLVEGGPWAWQLVAEHPNTPADVLEALKDQPSISLRLAIAGHPQTQSATLVFLCLDIEESIRAKAAIHPNRSNEIVRLLASAGATPDLRTATGFNHALASEHCRRLADLGPWGRFLAGRNPGCPLDLLADIATDPEWRVRTSLLDNPKTPSESLALLLGTQDPKELATVQQLHLTNPSPEALIILAQHAKPEIRLAVARHPAVTAQALRQLLTDRTKEVRRLAVNNPRTNPADIALLVQAGSTPDLLGLSDPDPVMAPAKIDALGRRGLWARQLAVRHPNSTPDTLARLLCDAEPKIREWAAVHPKADQETIKNLIRAGSGTDFQGFTPPDPTLSAEQLRQLSQLGPWAQYVVANNPHTPAELLAMLARSLDAQVRKLVAQNPSTPPTILTQLATDANVEVHALARQASISDKDG